MEQPLPDVRLALQQGKDGLEPPTESSAARVTFDFPVRLGTPQADGSPNFLGPFTQGPAASRFVYICVGREAGHGAGARVGRMKVPLGGITEVLVQRLFAAKGMRLAVRVPGRSPRGGPTLATVNLPPDAWKLVEDRAP